MFKVVDTITQLLSAWFFHSPYELEQRGNDALLEQRYQEAIGYYQKALVEMPTEFQGEVYFRLAFCQSQLGNLDKAIAATLRATRLEPFNCDYWIYGADLLHQKQETIEAIVLLGIAIDYNSQEPRLWLRVFQLAIASNNHQLAILAGCKALALRGEP